MVELSTALGLTSALAVITPGLILLLLIRGVKAPALRNLTALLASFGILHGLYHILLVIGQPTIGNPVDLLTVLVLIVLGVYYNMRVS